MCFNDSANKKLCVYLLIRETWPSILYLIYLVCVCMRIDTELLFLFP